MNKILSTMFADARNENHSLFRYMYNKKNFDPVKDTVFYSGPYWDDEEPLAAIEAFMTGKWLASGENVYKFEREFSKRFNKKHSVMVNSGSSANLVMIAALKKVMKWNDGDEIIVSVVGFPTTVNPIVQCGLTPVFVDISMTDLNWDVTQIESKITPRTRAVMSSPVLGNPYDYDIVVDLCTKYNLHLIADNCDSLGSKWNGKYLTDSAIAASTSFYPSHHITTGEGGMVSSDDSEIIKVARSFAWWGRDCHCVGSANTLPNGTCGNRFDKWLECHDGVVDHKYVFSNMGYNLKPLDFQGAIGLVQLKKFDEIEKKRMLHKQKMAEIFKKNLPELDVVEAKTEAHTSWFGVPIICPSSSQKMKLVSYLEANRIQTRNYFSGNLLMHPAYRHLGDYRDYPNASLVLERVFFVGCSPHYSTEVFDYVDKVTSEFCKAKTLPVLK